MIGFLLHSEKRKRASLLPANNEGLLILRNVREVDATYSPSKSTQSSCLSDTSKEEITSASLDDFKIDSCDSSSLEKTEINTMARSQRRIDIKEGVSSKILDVIHESNKVILKRDNANTHKVQIKDARQIKSLVTEKAQPMMSQDTMMKLYSIIDLLNRFEKYRVQSQHRGALVRFSQIAVLSKISKLLHIMYQVKKHKS